ncbi:MAG TPA: hypothetical protein VLH94_00750 [Spirochaetia bacterium]|nr:hypothetical protein [Spirochaetia bacterium]
MANNAFTLTGAKKSSPFGDTSSGILGSLTKSLGFSPASQTTPATNQTTATAPQQNMTYASQVQQGSNPGLLGPVKSTTDKAGTITQYETKPNPNVLAQQKALNALGAGLAEDGILGPKTREAIAKYGNTTTPTTPTPTTPKVEPPKPVSSAEPKEQIQNVGQAGQQTENESLTQARLIEQSQETSPEYKQLIKDIEQIQNNIRISKENYAKARTDLYAEPGGIVLKEGRDRLLQEQYRLEQAALSEQESALSTQLAAANAAQAMKIQAGGMAYTGAQNQAQRGLSAQGTVLGAGLLQPTTIGQVPYSPITGQAGGMLGGQGGLSTLGALQQQQQQGADVQNMTGAYNQAAPLIQTAKQQIASAGFNISPVALVNQLQQYVNKGIVPSAEYANIFNTLSEIATTISPVLGAQGAQTDLKTMIAQEFIPKLLQGQDIGTVLDNIEKNALAKIQALKATSQGAPLTVPSGSSTGGFAEQW